MVRKSFFAWHRITESEDQAGDMHGSRTVSHSLFEVCKAEDEGLDHHVSPRMPGSGKGQPKLWVIHSNQKD